MNTLTGWLTSLIKIQKASEKLLVSFLLVIGLSWIIFFIGSNYLFVRRIIAEQVCPLTSDLDGKIHGQQYLTATSSVNSFDCSTLDIIVATDGEIIFQSYKDGDGTLSGDYSGLLTVGNLTVESGGKITADGQGYLNIDNDNDNGRGGDGIGLSSGGGGGYGGAGGEGVAVAPDPSATTGHSYGNSENPIYLGGAGGNSGSGGLGGNGGGAIKINVVGTLIIDGSITANGLDGKTDNNSAGGAGAGGSIWLEANAFAGQGIIRADGGISENAQYKGGGGGGGRINMFCTDSNAYTGTLTALGGTGQVSFSGGNGSVLGATCKPHEPIVLKQFKVDQITEISSGSKTSETSILLVSSLIDPDFDDVLYLQIEIRKTSENFTNSYTHTHVLGYSNPKSCINGSVDCGKILISGLDRMTGYHWQARVKDSFGAYSQWVSYGYNAENEEDFYVSGIPSNISINSGNGQSSIVGSYLENPLEVYVSDSLGIPVAGASIDWSIIDGKTGGKFQNGYTTQTDINGLAINHYSVGTLVGQNIIKAQISGQSASINFTETGLVSTLASFRVDSVSVAIVNENFSFTIKPYDTYGNLITNFEGVVSLAAVKPLDTSTNATGNLSLQNITFSLSDQGIYTGNISFDNFESIKIKAYIDDIKGFTNSIAIVNQIGSCPDADGIIDTSQSWTADINNQGIFDCRNVPEVLITNNAVLTLVPYNNEFGVHILANDMTIDTDSVVTSTGYGLNGVSCDCGGTGGSHGGYGTANGATYGSVYQPTAFGSGGNGYWMGPGGGSGGGVIRLTVDDTLTNNGSITSNGNIVLPQLTNNGAGGSIWIDTNTIAGSGLISTNGGTNTGAGGRIALYYSSNTNYNLNTTGIQSYGYNGSGAGTVYIENKGVDPANGGILQIDNNNSNARNATLIEGDYSFKSVQLTRYGHLEVLGENSKITISDGDGMQGDSTRSKLTVNGTFNYIGTGTLKLSGIDLGINGKISGVDDFEVGGANPAALTLYAHTWWYDNTQTHSFNNMTIKDNGTVNLASYDGVDDYGVDLALNNLDIELGGSLTATGFGYTGIGCDCGGTGGSHGGYGTSNANTYGSVYQPTTFGGGGYGYWMGPAGGNGGGSIKLSVSGTITNNGVISSNGNVPVSGRTNNGAGGSIWIDTNNIIGEGSITTNGATNTGAGGRIAIYYDTNSGFNLNTTGLQSYGYNGAGPGTIYIENKNVDQFHIGTIIVDNNNSNARNATLLEDDYNFKSIELTRYGHLEVLGNNSRITLNNSNTIVGDSTQSRLTVNGIFNYIGTGTLEISGIDLGINGKITGVDDIEVGGTNPAALTLYAHTWWYSDLVTHFFNNLIIKSNGIVNLPSYDGATDYGVNLTLNNLDIELGGKLTATGYGYTGVGCDCGGVGGSHGGLGTSNGNTSGSVYQPITFGGAGYGYWMGPAGGNGGGAIKLNVIDTITNNGTISSDGNVPISGRTNNGAGGSIWIDANILTGTGTITANGGTNTGAGGRIAIYYNTNNDFNLNTTGVQAFGYNGSGPGTVYYEQKNIDPSNGGILQIDNNNSNARNANLLEGNYNFKLIQLTRFGHLEILGENSNVSLSAGDGIKGDSTKSKLITNGTLEYTGTGKFIIDGVTTEIKGNIIGINDLEVGGSNPGGLTLYAKTWHFNNSVIYDIFDNITVKSNGLITLYSKVDTGDLNQDYGIVFNADNLTVETGGVITSTGNGYAGGAGPGVGAWGGGWTGYGGAYGGFGPSSTPYGSVYEPSASGSGGGYSRWGCGGSSGGGAIKLIIDGAFINNGVIETNGGAWSCSNGSGGSIWLDANTMSGSGIMAANGAEGGYGGAGGRIAIYYDENIDYNLDIDHVHAFGGPNAGAGTVYLEQNNVDTHKGATLLIDNQGRDTYSAALPVQSDSNTYDFSLIKLSRYGHLELMDNNSHTSQLVLSSGSGLLGDNTRPILTISGILNYTGEGLLTLDGISLKINGDVQGLSDLTIGGQNPGGLILNAMTWHFNKTVIYDIFNNIIVKNNGLITMISKADTGDPNQDYGVNLSVDNLTIENGGIITSTGTGWGESTGPGGGAYGGWGAPGSGLHGNLYGSIYEPTTLGSGGGGSYGWSCSGSNGGGAIKISVNQNFINDGLIETRGGAWSCNDGAGGSVWIDTDTLSGNGYIDVDGSARGSGGRIAVYYNTNDNYNISTAGAHAFGGSAGPGTVYFENKVTQTVSRGDLILSNNGTSGNAQTFAAGIHKFNSVAIDPNVIVNIAGKTDNQSIKDALGTKPLTADANTVGLWHLDETSQSNLINNANVYNSGSPTSEVATITGKYGNAAYTSYGQNIAFNPITLPAEYTIDAWMLFPLPSTSEGWRSIIGRLEGTYHHIMIHQNGELGIYNGAWYSSGYNINSINEGWHHIALTVKDDSKFYIDGQLVGTVNTINTGNISVIGNYSSGTSWGGGIDDVRISTKELTPEEVDAIYFANVPAEVDSNTLALWNMDQVIKDSKVFSDKEFTDGGALGSTISSDGKFDNARSFDGVNDYILTTKLMDALNTFSYELWFKTDSTVGGSLLSFDNNQKPGSNAYDRKIYINNAGNISFGFYTHTVISPNTYNDGNWHQITATFAPDNGLHLYIDGQIVAQDENPFQPSNFSGFFKVGYGEQDGWSNVGSTNYYKGLIDEVKISTIKLSTEVVEANYNNSTELVSDDNTSALWHFNEIAQTQILDSGIVGNNLVSNNTTYGTGKFDNARYFNGVDSYLTAPAGFDDFTNGFTFEFWAKPEGTNGSNVRFFDFGNGCPDDNIIISRNANSPDMLVEIYQGGSLNSSTVISSIVLDNEWHHYAVTLRQSGMLEVLRDGVVFKNVIIGFPNDIVRNNNYIGRVCGGGGQIYRGYLDEVRILNKGLTTDEVNADYYGVTVDEYKLIYQTSAFGSGVIFDIRDNFTLAAGATINGVGQGYQSNQGSGKGEDSTNDGAGGGGGYGGDGGNAQTLGNGTPDAFGGRKYGDQNRPYALGSGGGRSELGALGGNGGGAIAIVNPFGTTTIDGIINVSGTNGLTSSPGGGGGAGGSIFILSSTANISGNLIANGGSGGDDALDGGTGGGGRISLLINGNILDSSALSNNISVLTGTPSALGTEGQDGTYPGLVVLPQINFTEQLKTNDVEIPVGGTTNEDSVKMKVRVSSQDGTESNVLTLRAQVEIAKTSENFEVLGSTLISSSTTTYAGGAPVEVEAVATGLVPSEIYKWRTRVYDVTNDLYGEWIEYGSNGDAADFIIGAATSISVIANSTNVQVGQAVSMTVSALDDNQNIDVNFVGIVDFNYAPSNLTEPDLPLSYQFNGADDGVHVFTNGFIFYEPGTYQIIASVRNNTTLIGYSQNIIVSALPTATPVPTDTPAPTDTTVPTQIPGEPTYTPTVIPTNTIVPTSTPIPSTIIYVSNTPFIVHPTPTIIARNVVISNVTKEIDDKDKSVKICWNTNINTIGYIGFGLVSDNLFTNVTSWENAYSTAHCITINNIDTDVKYIFKITSVSEQSKEKTLQDTFGSTKGVVIPVLPETGDCITVKPYAINAEKDLLIQYTTPYKAACSVKFGEKSDDLLFRASPFETTSILSHDATLSTKLFSQNLYYEINCNVEFPSGSKACSKTDLIPFCKFGDCGDYQPVVAENLPVISPIITLPILTTILAVNTISNPQFILYAFLWFRKGKNKKTWGIVYDEKSGKPVPYAIVKLFNVSNKLIQREITGTDGKYGFIMDKGKYKIEVQHNEYRSFKDEITVENNDNDFALDIPLTHTIKSKTNIFNIVITNLRKRLVLINNVLVAFGTVFSIIATILSPILFNYIILGVYIIQLILVLLPQIKRNYGIVKTPSGERVSNAFVRIYDVKEQRQIDVLLTDDKGRYKFKVKPGQYLIKVDKEDYIFPSERVKNIFKVSNDEKFIKAIVKKDYLNLDILLDKKPINKKLLYNAFGHKTESNTKQKMRNPFE